MKCTTFTDLNFTAVAPAPPWVYHVFGILNNLLNFLSGRSTEVKSIYVRVAKIENSKQTVEDVKA